MSFGFSVGDFVGVLKIAKSVHQACKDGPKEYREIGNEAKSIQFVVNSLCEDAKNPDSLLNAKGVDRKDELMEIVNNCKATMETFQALLEKRSVLKDTSNGGFKRIWHAYHTGSANLDSMRGKFMLHANCIQCFLQSLEGPSLVRIEQKIDMIYAQLLQDDANEDTQSLMSYESTGSMLSVLSQIETNEDDAWALMKKELLAENVSMLQLMAHKDTIIQYMKSLITFDLSSTVVAKPVGDRMPSPLAGDVVEKSSLVEMMTPSYLNYLSIGELDQPRVLFVKGGGITAHANGIVDGIYAGFLACMIFFDLKLYSQDIGSTVLSREDPCTLYFQDGNLGKFNHLVTMTRPELPFAVVREISSSIDSSFSCDTCWTVAAGWRETWVNGPNAPIEIYRPLKSRHQGCNQLRLRVGIIVTHNRSPFTLRLHATSSSQKVDFDIKPHSHGNLPVFRRHDLEVITQSTLLPSSI